MNGGDKRKGPGREKADGERQKLKRKGMTKERERGGERKEREGNVHTRTKERWGKTLNESEKSGRRHKRGPRGEKRERRWREKREREGETKEREDGEREIVHVRPNFVPSVERNIQLQYWISMQQNKYLNFAIHMSWE